MNRTAIYPGTFDPITYGHIDLISKSLKIVDKLIVAISEAGHKNYLFSISSIMWFSGDIKNTTWLPLKAFAFLGSVICMQCNDFKNLILFFGLKIEYKKLLM